MWVLAVWVNPDWEAPELRCQQYETKTKIITCKVNEHNCWEKERESETEKEGDREGSIWVFALGISPNNCTRTCSTPPPFQVLLRPENLQYLSPGCFHPHCYVYTPYLSCEGSCPIQYWSCRKALATTRAVHEGTHEHSCVLRRRIGTVISYRPWQKRMSRKASFELEHINLPWKPGPDKEVLCHIALHGAMLNIKL